MKAEAAQLILKGEAFDASPKPSHHGKHSINFKAAAQLRPREGRSAHSRLGRDLRPRHGLRPTFGIQRFVESFRVEASGQIVVREPSTKLRFSH